jgi:hypothetical protein
LQKCGIVATTLTTALSKKLGGLREGVLLFPSRSCLAVLLYED